MWIEGINLYNTDSFDEIEAIKANGKYKILGRRGDNTTLLQSYKRPEDAFANYYEICRGFREDKSYVYLEYDRA